MFDFTEYVSIEDANGNIVSVELSQVRKLFSHNLFADVVIYDLNYLEVKALKDLYFCLGGESPISEEKIKRLIPERRTK